MFQRNTAVYSAYDYCTSYCICGRHLSCSWSTVTQRAIKNWLPKVLNLPVLVQERFFLNSLTLFLFFCLLIEKSFHYSSPMDPPCPGMATDSLKEREWHGLATLIHFLPYGIIPYTMTDHPF
ncbi:hypothetical protein TNCV_3874291 [Trichonephila clavipes]|nr:hypothetical protein TNCV_3874291 [Trichonephila clavipes]